MQEHPIAEKKKAELIKLYGLATSAGWDDIVKSYLWIATGVPIGTSYADLVLIVLTRTLGIVRMKPDFDETVRAAKERGTLNDDRKIRQLEWAYDEGVLADLGIPFDVVNGNADIRSALSEFWGALRNIHAACT